MDIEQLYLQAERHHKERMDAYKEKVNETDTALEKLIIYQVCRMFIELGILILLILIAF